MLMACLLGAAAVAQAADYLLPETICLTPKGDALVIGERGAGKVSVRDFQGKELRSVTAVKKVGGFLGLFREERTLPVTGIAMAQDGTLFYTADDGNEGVLFREGEDPVPAGNRPMTPTLSPDGKYVYVCDRFGAKVRKFDAKTLECLAEAPAVREANGCALGKDGKLLFVINMLPDDAAEPVKYVAARVTVIDTATFKVLDNVHLPDVVLPKALWPTYGLDMSTHLPPYDFCYCPRCKAAFGKEPDPADPAWADFRLTQVAAVANTVADAVRAACASCRAAPTTPSRLSATSPPAPRPPSTPSSSPPAPASPKTAPTRRCATSKRPPRPAPKTRAPTSTWPSPSSVCRPPTLTAPSPPSSTSRASSSAASAPSPSSAASTWNNPNRAPPWTP